MSRTALPILSRTLLISTASLVLAAQAGHLKLPIVIAQDATSPTSQQVIEAEPQANTVTADQQLQIESNQIQLTAIPPRLGEDLSIKALPGQTVQTSVRIKNSSLQPQTVRTIVEDFIVGEDGEQPVPVSEETPNQWSLASWVTLSPSTQLLEPNQTAMVNILIEVPEDALPGGRYAMIMHEPSNEFQVNGSSSGVSQRVGTLLYFIVDGPINQEAYITNVQHPTFVETGPIDISFEIDNRSDIHIRPNTVVEIRNMFGQLSGVLEVEPKNVFPYTSRSFATNWDRIWGFGKYSALITTNYGTQGQVTRHVSTFWMLPVQLILAGGVVFATLVVLIILLRRHLNHRADSQRQEIEMLERKLRELEKDHLDKYTDDKN